MMFYNAAINDVNTIQAMFKGFDEDEEVWQIIDVERKISQDQYIFVIPASTCPADAAAPLIGEICKVKEIVMLTSQYARITVVEVTFDEEDIPEDAVFYLSDRLLYSVNY
jgi:hypothetical protein